MLRVGIIGRTRPLLEAASLLVENGFSVPFIHTCKAEPFYRCDEKEFEALASSIKADFYCHTSINSPEYVKTMKAYQCDVAISTNWLTILQSPILSAFKHGVYNAHAGDLPRYRGNACPNWAILNGEDFIGLSIHQMQAGVLDSGDIALKVFFKLRPDTYIGDIYQWISQQIPRLFLKLVKQIHSQTIQHTPQSKDEADILRCYPRKPEDSKIIWKSDAQNVLRLIRASADPFPGAFCSLRGHGVVRIWKAKLVKHEGDFFAIAGQVLYKIHGDPVVACGKGALQVTQASLDEGGYDAKPIILKSLRNRLE